MSDWRRASFQSGTLSVKSSQRPSLLRSGAPTCRMFWTSRNVIGRLVWADADVAIATDAPMTEYARQRGTNSELRTVGMEEGEKRPGGHGGKCGVATQAGRDRACLDSYAFAAADVDVPCAGKR